LRGERGLKAMAKTKEILASVGLTSKMSSFPGQLSGGEQQRVSRSRELSLRSLQLFSPTSQLPRWTQ
jgi:predicted ABC-type transport system involved in lysophospholipase L1 biosynthesis ATPase subunit